MIDPLDTDAQKAELERLARKERRRQEVEKLQMRKQLSKEDGRTFVMGIIERAGVFQQSFVPPGPNGDGRRETDFALGMRNEGLRMFKLIVDSCPELWSVMLRERQVRIDADNKEETQ